MNIQKLVKILTDAGIEENEAKYEIKMLLEHFCKYTENDRLLGKSISDEQYQLIKTKLEERVLKHTPVQYLIGEAWFMGNFFKVTPDVLIPRDETEILVRRAIEIINRNNFEDVLDTISCYYSALDGVKRKVTVVQIINQYNEQADKYRKMFAK